MKSRNLMKTGAILTLLFFFPMVLWAVNNPVKLLESVANQMIDKLKATKMSLKKNPAQVYSFAERIIVPHADLALMSQRVLPRATWNNASALEKRQFEKVFKTTLIRTYASALAQYRDQTVKFYDVHGGYAGKTRVSVDSRITSKEEGSSIHVSYDLVLSGGQWKLYDMTVEGVSMLQSFRSQFNDALSNKKNTIADLINILQKHNKNND